MPDPDPARPRLGIIVNPLAGIGGAVALKGSDGAETVAAARRRGAVPQAPARAARTLRTLATLNGGAKLLAAPGVMGADAARVAGFEATVTAPSSGSVTTAADTRAAALAMREAGVDLLLFAGGDGTARDILDAVGDTVPVVGIPAGVKMHSGVFAHSPEAAAQAGARFLLGGTPPPLRWADVADVDEAAAREGRVASVLYGSARVPDLPRLVLSAKAGSRTDPEHALQALCRRVGEELDPDALHLIGPGTTTGLVLDALGEVGTLLGVDAVHAGRVVGRDLTAQQILELMDEHADTRLILGLVGGQGALLGRGNKQLTPAVLRRIPRDRMVILSSADKLLALDPPCLWVDTGDPTLDAALEGYVRVDVAPGRQVVMRIAS